MFKQGKKYKRPFQKRINLNTKPLCHVSMDIKHMPNSAASYKFILVMICEITNYVICAPLKAARAINVCEAIEDHMIKYFGPPQVLICDRDPAFVSELNEYFTKKLGIKLITVSPTNHKSLKAEHGIKSLSNIIMKHLVGLGKMWPKFLPYAMLRYNSFASPNLDNFSPFELAFGRKPFISPSLEIEPSAPQSSTFRDYFKELQAKLQYLSRHLALYRERKLDLLNKDREYYSYQSGQIVYLFHPKGSILQSGSRKIQSLYVGPLCIYKVISPNLFILMSLDGVVYPQLIEETRIKPGYVRTTRGNVSTLADLKAILRSNLKLAS